MLDAGVEGDVQAQADVVGVVVEVLADVGVVGEVGVGGGHGEVRVGHALTGDVYEQVAVGGGHAVAVAEDPVATDLVGLLEAVEGDAALVQGLCIGDAGGAGADDARTGDVARLGAPVRHHRRTLSSVSRTSLCVRTGIRRSVTATSRPSRSSRRIGVTVAAIPEAYRADWRDGRRAQTRQVCVAEARMSRIWALPGSVSSQSRRTVLDMPTLATFRVLCETSPSFGTAIVNGLLAWAAVLGGFTVLFSGMPAAVALFIPSRPETLARRINRGLGQGVALGMMLGPLTLFVFIDKVVS